MWALIGYKRKCWPEDEVEEDIVALFSNYEKAKEYVSRARLKSAPKIGGRPFEVFRKKSLLAGYTDAVIEEYEEPDYDIDPEI